MRKVRKSLSLPRSLAIKLDSEAKKDGRSFNAFTERLLVKIFPETVIQSDKKARTK